MILSTNPHAAAAWRLMLSAEHNVVVLNDLGAADNCIKQQLITFIIIDADNFDTDNTQRAVYTTNGLKSLVIGHNWPEDRQIKALVTGHSGYCDAEKDIQQLLKATNSILNGDLWIKRQLVPKVIDMLMSFNSAHTAAQPNKQKIEFKKNLQTLTHRELDVAKMISTGQSNKKIASLLNISERTVKAHLTSIFQKLNVQDRLRLAILFKENHEY